MIGLSNGMIFALVALGYTLVYGIIELINFAHGDIFMLGTLETQSIFADGSLQIPLLFFTISIPLGTAASVTSSGREKAYAIAVALLASMALCLAINVAIERIGYKPLRNQPRLAPLITAIGFSFILQGVGLAWKGEGRIAIPQLIPNTVLIGDGGTLIDVGDAPFYTVRDLMVLLITAPVLLAADVARAGHEARKGDARHGAGSRRVGDDGDQRRPHDLLHVRARWRDRRGRVGGLCALRRDDRASSSDSVSA